jgi:hypothetical protein
MKGIHQNDDKEAEDGSMILGNMSNVSVVFAVYVRELPDCVVAFASPAAL